MFCYKCGAKIPGGAKFCPVCGVAQPSAGPSPQDKPASAPQATIAAPPASAAQSATAAQPAPGKKNVTRRGALIAAGSVLGVAAIGAGAYLLSRRDDSGDDLDDASDAAATTSDDGASASVQATGEATAERDGVRCVVVTADGERIESLERPAIVSIASGAATLRPVPALSLDDASAGGGSASENSTTVDGSSAAPLKNAYGTLSSLTAASGLSNVVNAEDFYLTDALAAAIAQNQFAVYETSYGDAEFFDLYESNRYACLPSFVTVDSMMHTYHLYFAYLLKNTEKGYLSSLLLSMSTALLEASVEQLEALQGSEWEEAALRNCAFFGVGGVLLGSDVEVPSDVAQTVQDEVAKINAAEGIADCALTGSEEDYSQYKPRGYYEGDDALERYFRTMMWYGRINFAQKEEDLDRSALLITLALDGGQGGTANADWSAAYTVTSFFAGASDDCGYYEYYPLFEAAYGAGAGVDDLAGNDSAWEAFHGLTALMRAPAISSVVVGDETEVTDDDIKGFRVMGQRFSLDEAIFQQLVYDNVNDRLLPCALDLPAALGSDEALSILCDEGEDSYGGYTAQMTVAREAMASAADEVWSASLYSQWLYTLNPLLTEKGAGYPDFMRSSAWRRRGLQAYLGSYTELKHDTVLYSKQVMAEMGGDSIVLDDRGYVEPEPEVFARLTDLVDATSAGLKGYGLLSSADEENLARLQELASQFKGMAEKELAGEELSSDEYDLIRDYGGTLEHFWDEVNPDVEGGAMKSREAPAAVIVDVATDATNGLCLELGTGTVNQIYVVVPIAGELHLCKGGVYSYYEFEQPISNRLTDSEWREMLGIVAPYTVSADLPDEPAWTNAFTIQAA